MNTSTENIMRIEYLKLAEDITSLTSNKTLLYVTYDGNWGDALIRYGTEMFFNYFGIQYKKLALNSSSLKKNLTLLRAKRKKV